MNGNAGASLIRADALRLPLADNTVDLLITSPPYFALRSYQDNGEHYAHQLGSEPTPAEFLDALWAATAEMARVLKPTGSMFVNLGDKYSTTPRQTYRGSNTGRLSWSANKTKFQGDQIHRADPVTDIRPKSLMGLPWRYALGCIDQLGLILRAELVWSKPNGLPESVTDRVRRSHEQWFHFTKEPRYYSAIDEIREPQTGDSPIGRENAWGISSRRHAARGPGDGHSFNVNYASPLGKLPGSVWSVPSEPLVVPEWVGVDHFAAFPQEWPRRLVLGWSPPGICTACGEGRRPVVDKELVPHRHNLRTDHKHSSGLGVGPDFAQMEVPVAHQSATITGYVCACEVPVAATRPAVVLDPFAGTGTVPMVARVLGRFGVGVDLSADYLRLAVWRVFRSGHGAKSVGRTNRDRQGDLFSGAL
jgi:DNA modification methylase